MTASSYATDGEPHNYVKCSRPAKTNIRVTDPAIHLTYRPVGRSFGLYLTICVRAHTGLICSVRDAPVVVVGLKSKRAFPTPVYAQYMVRERLTDGTRIAELLASEVESGGGALSPLSLSDANPEVDPTSDGALAYRVVRPAERQGGDDPPTAEVFVQPDCARVEFLSHPAIAATAASESSLSVQSNSPSSSRAHVLVESGAEVKRARDVFEAVVQAADS